MHYSVANSMGTPELPSGCENWFVSNAHHGQSSMHCLKERSLSHLLCSFPCWTLLRSHSFRVHATRELASGFEAQRIKTQMQGFWFQVQATVFWRRVPYFLTERAGCCYWQTLHRPLKLWRRVLCVYSAGKDPVCLIVHARISYHVWSAAAFPAATSQVQAP
jgi:hypothetical protein